MVLAVVHVHLAAIPFKAFRTITPVRRVRLLPTGASVQTGAGLASAHVLLAHQTGKAGRACAGVVTGSVQTSSVVQARTVGAAVDVLLAPVSCEPCRTPADEPRGEDRVRLRGAIHACPSVLARV